MGQGQRSHGSRSSVKWTMVSLKVKVTRSKTSEWIIKSTRPNKNHPKAGGLTSTSSCIFYLSVCCRGPWHSWNYKMCYTSRQNAAQDSRTISWIWKVSANIICYVVWCKYSNHQQFCNSLTENRKFAHTYHVYMSFIPWPIFSANQKPRLLRVYDPIYPFRTRGIWSHIPLENLISPSYEFLSWYICHIPLPPRGISNRIKFKFKFKCYAMYLVNKMEPCHNLHLHQVFLPTYLNSFVIV